MTTVHTAILSAALHQPAAEQQLLSGLDKPNISQAEYTLHHTASILKEMHHI